MPTGAALRAILLRLLDTLEANQAGAREDRDGEFLHDFRVAVRRSRTVLGQFKPLFPPAIARRFRKEFAWLGEITGPTRDLDVYLLDFPRYQQALPETLRADLLPLQKYLRRHQRQEQRLLARRLAGKRYRRLVGEWRAWLVAPPADHSDPPEAGRPVLELANWRIWKNFQQVIEEGEALGPDSPDEDFHELRKSCKKLRYLLEFFADLYPLQQHRQLVKNLKQLQDLLGSFQDLSVQAGALRDFSLQMSRERDIPPATLLAMGMLIEQLLERQHQLRGRFSQCFAGFASAPTRQCFAELFADKATTLDMAQRKD